MALDPKAINEAENAEGNAKSLRRRPAEATATAPPTSVKLNPDNKHGSGSGRSAQGPHPSRPPASPPAAPAAPRRGLGYLKRHLRRSAAALRCHLIGAA